MKKGNFINRALALAVVAFVSVAGFAKGNILIHPYLKTSYAIVSAQHALIEPFKVKIVADNGETLYESPRIKNEANFQKLFDLESFNDGDYKVVLIGKKSKSEERFSIIDHKIVKAADSEAKTASTLDTFFRKVDNRLFVSHLNFNNQPMSLSIYDDESNKLFTTNLEATSSYSGMFDISELPVGEYCVNFQSGEKSYSYEFEK
ncbi:hypothetical protein DMA11_02820 [Marinilabiliaceae bacterium JC017]|nr:hypothetical protein DMA11_02820 [Marinilabiliaceae bacterium JC017]